MQRVETLFIRLRQARHRLYRAGPTKTGISDHYSLGLYFRSRKARSGWSVVTRLYGIGLETRHKANG